MELSSRYQGAGLGLLLGDAHGAPREGGPLEKALWWLIGRTHGKRRFTDDSQMAFDLGEHLVQYGKIEHQKLLLQFADSYRWSRGYGPSTVTVLKAARRGLDWQNATRVRFPAGSFGNGAAMRIAPLAVFLHQRVQPEEAIPWFRQSAEVTHPHPLAMDGAVALGLCILLSFDEVDCFEILKNVTNCMETAAMREKLQRVTETLKENSTQSARAAKKSLGAGTAALESVPLSIYLGFRYRESGFEELLESANRGGGDTDTIAAMAGALWGSQRGDSAFDSSLLNNTEAVDEMRSLMMRLRAKNILQ
ncbi:MAG: ADP-ribosylglycohydrolase family protein [Candidatus Sumerlaeia bacterium]|nr:ADP-ribosylglycohydrolase family protein [Candidatus Sumerlaeia bacterium]